MQAVSPRVALHEDLRRRAMGLLEPVIAGYHDGMQVVTRKALEELFAEPLPPVAITEGEVATPARQVVHANCPECHEPTEIEQTIKVELRIDDDGSKLHLKPKSKDRSHFCGQTTLPLRHDAADGQVDAFPDEDDVEDDDEGPRLLAAGAIADAELAKELEAESSAERTPDVDPGEDWGTTPALCDFPACTKPLGHRGRHSPTSIPRFHETSTGHIDNDDLLPGEEAVTRGEEPSRSQADLDAFVDLPF